MTEKSVYTQLAEHIGHGDSKYVPDIFKVLASEDDAKLMLSAKAPSTIPELKERTGFSEEMIGKTLDDLFYKGLIYKSKKPEGIKYYTVRNVIQFHDATIIVDDPSQEMLDLWKKYDDEEWGPYFSNLSTIFAVPPTRVVAINQSIDSQSKILSVDDITKAVDDARIIAVTKCSCRVVHGACGMPVEVCIQIDKAADYSLERETGREITKEQAVTILKDCGEKGLVHIAANKKGIGMTICNCCKDCCENWAGGDKFVAPSRYAATVDAEACSGCEACMDRCFFDAVSMEEDTAVVDHEKCKGCGVCLTDCPEDAILLKIVRPEEFIPA